MPSPKLITIDAVECTDVVLGDKPEDAAEAPVLAFRVKRKDHDFYVRPETLQPGSQIRKKGDKGKIVVPEEFAQQVQEPR